MGFMGLFIAFTVMVIGGLAAAIGGAVMLINAWRTAHGTQKQTQMQHPQYKEPISVSLCGAIGALLFVPMIYVVLIVILALTNKYPNLPMTLIVICAVVAIALFIAPALMKDINNKNRTAMRLAGIWALILLASGVIASKSDFHAQDVANIIIGGFFLALPNLLTKEKKYQTVFRCIGALFLASVLFTNTFMSDYFV